MSARCIIKDVGLARHVGEQFYVWMRVPSKFLVMGELISTNEGFAIMDKERKQIDLVKGETRVGYDDCIGRVRMYEYVN